MKTNKILTVCGITAMFTVALASCNKKVSTGAVHVIHETKFNSAYVELQNEDLKNMGFSFGDSCNIYFSNGKSILDVPYYDGYYTRSDYPLICGYQGYPYVQLTINNSSCYWDTYELDENTTVKIELNEAKKYSAVQDAFSMTYLNDRTAYTTDEEFANFRSMQVGDIKNNVIFRGASPFNNTYNRSSYVDKLLKDNGVNYILDLADAKEDYDNYFTVYDLTDSYAAMQKKSFLNMGSNFRDMKYKTALANGLKDMLTVDGRYYVHCTEGKDRTGFVCALLEGLCNASYDEMVKDYMQTYKNYFGMKEEDLKYAAVIQLRFDEFLEYLTGLTDINTIKTMKYKAYCESYLEEGGMTKNEISTLVNKLTK